jgi:histidyl-tRNA synthetase
VSENFELMNAKGVRDFLPEDKIPRQEIMDRLKTIFERYGFSPLETPAIERLDVLTAKFAGGEEIIKEVFKLRDQGGRDLALRYDLTVPMSKVVGMNPNLNLPFKRYQMQPVWRDGPIKLGRYREFWQCDVDIVGVKSMIADAEILSILDTVFRNFGFDFVIKVNNRKLLNGIMEYAGFGEYSMKAILAIDKLAKIGGKGVRNELAELGFEKDEVKRTMDVIKIKGTNAAILKKLKNLIKSKEGQEGIREMEDILRYCGMMGVENIRFDVSLARGLEYYTGPVYEVYLKRSKVTSSVAGGGRYDKMIGMFLGGGKEYPATGVSFGIEPIYEALKLSKKLERKKTVTQVFVIPINTLEKSLKVASKLRKVGVKTETDLLGRGISKNLSYADSMGIPYVLFVGERELKKKKFKLRNMKSGKEKFLRIEDIPKELK